MRLSPRPGCTGQQILETLRAALEQLDNVRGAGGDAAARSHVFVRWGADQARMLRYQLPTEDIQALILNHGYDRVLGLAYDEAPARLNALLDLAVEDARSGLKSVIDELASLLRGWQAGHLLVPDTNLFIEADVEIDHLDFSALLATRGDPIHVVVPIAVIDELDGLKRTGGAHAKTRARRALRILSECLSSGGLSGLLREGDFTEVTSGALPRGRVTVEVALDPPGHVRLPITDDEIVDRAVTIARLAGRQVRVASADTGMRLRLRAHESDLTYVSVPLGTTAR